MTDKKLMPEQLEKVGVYICHCGLNIGGVINIDNLIEFVKTLPFVSEARQYKIFCSEV